MANGFRCAKCNNQEAAHVDVKRQVVEYFMENRNRNEVSNEMFWKKYHELADKNGYNQLCDEYQQTMEEQMSVG